MSEELGTRGLGVTGLPDLFTPYTVIVLGALAVTACAWLWMIRSGRVADRRLLVVYAGALVGAALGAKAAFLLAEGWRYQGDLVAMLTGRSITGALLGGYAGVELAKHWVGYRKRTGDLFAIIVPIGLAIGRVGCIVQGCCPGIECTGGGCWWAATDAAGVARWPAAWVEMGFNLAFAAWVAAAVRRGWRRGNRFHVYLIAYGVFRFAHEFLRADARWVGWFGGYHALALGLLALGVWGLRRPMPGEGPSARDRGPSRDTGGSVSATTPAGQ